MSAEQERDEFDGRYASEGLEMTVLTGATAAGAGRAGGDVLWTVSSDVIAYVDHDGSVVRDEGRLSWLAADRQQGTWIHDLKPATQYVVRARRRVMPDPAEYTRRGLPVPDLSRHFALDRVIERDVHLPALEEHLRSWLQPVTVSTDIGTFHLDRSIGWFTGSVLWNGREVPVTLGIDGDSSAGTETCRGALTCLTRLVASAESVDAYWRACAASNLIELANVWRQEADPSTLESVTPSIFVQRISLSELSVEADGSMNPYYDDDDMFGGHLIALDGEPDGTISDASIAG